MEINKRKTIKKQSTGRWTKPQSQRFMNALEKYGRNWTSIQKAVKTRSLTQIRSHAQKFFMKISQADIQALIGKDQPEEEDETFQKYQERDQTNIFSYELPEKKQKEGNLFETMKKCIEENTNELPIQTQIQINSEQNSWLPSQVQLQKQIPLNEQSYFLGVIRNNYGHFRSGKSILDMTNAYNNQQTIGFTPFNHKYQQKEFQINFQQ